MLPLEKALVESLFQDNLLRVVFATETLAAGVLPSYHPSHRRPSPQACYLVITPRIGDSAADIITAARRRRAFLFPSYPPSPCHARHQHARTLHGRLGSVQAWQPRH